MRWLDGKPSSRLAATFYGHAFRTAQRLGHKPEIEAHCITCLKIDGRKAHLIETESEDTDRVTTRLNFGESESPSRVAVRPEQLANDELDSWCWYTGRITNCTDEGSNVRLSRRGAHQPTGEDHCSSQPKESHRPPIFWCCLPDPASAAATYRAGAQFDVF
jgi:hypothetical protein